MTSGLPYNFLDLVNVMSSIKDNVFNNLNCHQVGTIQSFDPDSQTAVVTINTKRLVALNPNQWEDYSPLIDCPVIISGNKDQRITFPINSGDECLILFNDREIDNWLSKGGSQPFTIGRTHDFSDAIILVGLRNSNNTLPTYNNEAIELNNSDTCKLSIYNDHIEIIGSITSLNDIISGTVSLQNHTHNYLLNGHLTSTTPPLS